MLHAATIYPVIDSLLPGDIFRPKDDYAIYVKRVMVWDEPARNTGINIHTGEVRYFNPCDMVVALGRYRPTAA